uniref:WD_REPEATS_REGION domain-containing protein n=1 Tax=Macrostomum lignano TaxID=282301 RepID=A0A1I8FTC9_9PLAT
WAQNLGRAAASPARGPVRLEAGPSIAGSPEDEGLFALCYVDGDRRLVLGTGSEGIRCLAADFAAGGEAAVLAEAVTVKQNQPFGGLAVACVRGHLATVGSDCSVRVYDLRTCQPVRQYSGYRDLDPDCPEGHATRLFAARFNADGLLLTSGWDDCVKFWDLRLASGDPVRRLSGPHICCPDGLDVKATALLPRRLGSTALGRQAVRGPLTSWPADHVYCARFTAKSTVASAGALSRCLTVWPAAVTSETSPEPLARLELDSAVYSMAAAEDGRLAVGCRSGRLQLARLRRHPEKKLSVLGYADDLALLSSTAEGAQRLLDGLTAAAARVGLVFNARKTEVPTVLHDLPAEIRLRDGDGPGTALPKCLQFVYLGGLVPDIGDDLARRRGKAWAAFRSMRALLLSEALSDGARSQLFQAVVETALLYNAETWTLTGALGAQLDAAHAALVRAAFGAARRPW